MTKHHSIKQGLILLILVLFSICRAEGQIMRDSVWREDVKTVQLYRAGAELDLPVLRMGSGEVLVLEFDVLKTEAESLRWSVRHCDREWRLDGLEGYEFMTGFDEGALDEYDFSFTTLRDFVHYKATLFGQGSEFLQSGNYVLTVRVEETESRRVEESKSQRDEESKGQVLLTRRFWVSEEATGCEAYVGRPYDGVEVERRQEVDVKIENSKLKIENGFALQLRPEYINVMVRQNGREDNARWLEMSGYEGDALVYGGRSCNIFDGGNTFRWFDCSSLHSGMYNMVRVEEYGGEQFVILRPEEDRSKNHYVKEKGLMGGMKVNNRERNNPTLEADYVWVNFSLPMGTPMLDGSIYIVGALTDWQLDESSVMEYDMRLRAYTKRLLLKQGYYSYQLLVKRPKEKEGVTRKLEGDHRETENVYTVFVYYHSPADRGDRLVRVIQRRGGQ